MVDMRELAQSLRIHSRNFSVSSEVGFVFHGSRCGSTLVSNLLTAVSDHVFSEHGSPVAVLHTCSLLQSRCDVVKTAELLQDVFNVLHHGRGRVFHKFASITWISNITRIFPEVPWIFLYRDPSEILMSQLKNGNSTFLSKAHCLRQRKQPPGSLKSLVIASGRNVTDLTAIEFCAAYLVRVPFGLYSERRVTYGVFDQGGPM